MPLCIKFNLNLQNHYKKRLQKRFRQVHELKSMKILYYERQCDQENPLEKIQNLYLAPSK